MAESPAVPDEPDHRVAEPDLMVPKASVVDYARGLGTAAAQLDPRAASIAEVIATVFPTALERRSTRFHQQLIETLTRLVASHNDLADAFHEGIALAALTQGCMASARSASDEHLEYLANATARAMTTEDERRNDHAMLLLRLAGDISGTHIRILLMYANPHAYALERGLEFMWVENNSRYLLDQVTNDLAPELDADTATAMRFDLDRLGLMGDDSAWGKTDAGVWRSEPSEIVTTVGRALLEFVAPIE